MAVTHTVQPGETLHSIANAYGFRDWRRIYDHPENQALRDAGRTPDVLFAGDVVHVPTLEPKWVSCQTERVHEFVVSRPPYAFAVELDGLPATHAGGAYRLDAEGEVIRGHVPASGRIRHDLRRPIKSVTLTIDPVSPTDPANDEEPTSPLELEFSVGHLDPVSEVTGVQGRLANLGFYEGEIDGDAAQHTRSAIAEFRRTEGLPDGESIDSPMSDRLAQRHGV